MECHKAFEHSVVASIFGDGRHAGHGNFMSFILAFFFKTSKSFKSHHAKRKELVNRYFQLGCANRDEQMSSLDDHFPY